ncbi:OsmC family protein [Flaviflagellibacter deserti]|jgi:organic hydroperoxide reductase OsmC/OhrA|uniref:OsmC family protein n=1 Tax=Flaviflagellibacter deserti TaxID=2267266 RepID=A0ABV9YXX3_9HYPH
MASVNVDLRSVDGTEAAMGWAAGHTITVDRPDGKAGGLGLGFNGAQLLALAIGGCFCNDLRYTAHTMGVALGKIAVSVRVDMEGEPLLTTNATMVVQCETMDGSDPQAVIAKAKAACMVANSLRQGIPVAIES